MVTKEQVKKCIDKYLNDYLSTQEDIEAFGYAMECVEEQPYTRCYLDSPCEYQNPDIKIPKHQCIVWHPYPDEKPKDLNDKLVTIRESNGNRYTSIGYFDEKQWYGRSGFWIPNNSVTAWAELPKPYEEGAEE